MPIPPLAIAPLLGEILTVVIAGAAIGGSIAGYCAEHPGTGCANKGHRVPGVDSIVPDVPVVMMDKRADVGPCNVPLYNFDICRDQIKNQGKQIWSSIPEPGVARFENIPPACMNLAVVLSGSCTGEGTSPVPCGSACMQYTGLSDDQMRSLSSALGG